jgi:hypothetical protein
MKNQPQHPRIIMVPVNGPKRITRAASKRLEEEKDIDSKRTRRINKNITDSDFEKSSVVHTSAIEDILSSIKEDDKEYIEEDKYETYQQKENERLEAERKSNLTQYQT